MGSDNHFFLLSQLINPTYLLLEGPHLKCLADLPTKSMCIPCFYRYIHAWGEQWGRGGS